MTLQENDVEDTSLIDSPLLGADRIKVISFFAIISPPIFMIYGDEIIFYTMFFFTLIVLSSLYLMKRYKSFTPILYARKVIKVYLVIALLIIMGLSIMGYYAGNLFLGYSMHKPIINPNINSETAIYAVSALALVPVVVIALVWLFNFLYFIPMQKHQNWVVQHGIFSKDD